MTMLILHTTIVGMAAWMMVAAVIPVVCASPPPLLYGKKDPKLVISRFHNNDNSNQDQEKSGLRGGDRGDVDNEEKKSFIGRNIKEGSSGRSSPSIPFFSSSFTVGNVTYPYTMVGYPPESGKSALIRSVIIPLRINIVISLDDGTLVATFDPEEAVKSIVSSPIYVNTNFSNGFYGQFGDQMQRAAFWNKMDKGRKWHVRMATPTVLPTIDIETYPDLGDLNVTSNGVPYSYAFHDGEFFVSQLKTILQLLKLPADVLPIFVTKDVYIEGSLGLHVAYPVPSSDSNGNGGGGTRVQTVIWTGWFDAVKAPLFPDVYPFSHELMEWMNDPFGNNSAPNWVFPPATDPRGGCSNIPLLEVGDPTSNSEIASQYFPAVPITMPGGITYRLQNMVMWQWFTGQKPSSAYGGWYSFLDPKAVTEPAVFC